MTEIFEIRPLKSVKHQHSLALTTIETSSDALSSSDDDDDSSSSNNEAPIIFQLQSKPAKKPKRNKPKIQTLPMILTSQSSKPSHTKHIQQFLINSQPPIPSYPKKKDVVIKQIIQPTLISDTQYVATRSVPTIPFEKVVERQPIIYRSGYTPAIIEERALNVYNSYESPIKRIIETQQSNSKNVHLPKHAKKLVNRFLNRLEHAHNRRLYEDDSDSDRSIDDCRICRRLRSSLDIRRHRSNSLLDLSYAARPLFETDEPHHHRHNYSKTCRSCQSFERPDIDFSHTKVYSTNNAKRREKHVHEIESFPSNIKPAIETTTTTTTTTQPKVPVNNPPPTIAPIPIQSSFYPTPYATYIDQNTGITYAYDPNWPYYQSTTSGIPYDPSAYYPNPAYIQSNMPYETYMHPHVSVINDPSYITTQQQQAQQQIIQTKEIVNPNPNPLLDKGTYTYIPAHRKKHKKRSREIVVQRSRDLTPSKPRVIIEKTNSTEVPTKSQSTTIIKERIPQTSQSISHI